MNQQFTPQQKRAMTVEIKALTEYIDELKSCQRGNRIFFYHGELKTRTDIRVLEIELDTLKKQRSEMNFKK